MSLTLPSVSSDPMRSHSHPPWGGEKQGTELSTGLAPDGLELASPTLLVTQKGSVRGLCLYQGGPDTAQRWKPHSAGGLPVVPHPWQSMTASWGEGMAACHQDHQGASSASHLCTCSTKTCSQVTRDPCAAVCTAASFSQPRQQMQPVSTNARKGE